MKKVMPAVFFQKRLNGVQTAARKPERLELFESELRAVVGGMPPTGGPDGSGGLETYSGSFGWADVMNADDCT
jgi:hypothetical protein